MTTAAVLWAGVILGLLLLYFASIVHRQKRVPEKRDLRLVRSDDHNAQVRAIQEWLSDRKIVQTIVDERIVTLDVLKGILDTVEGRTEGEVAAAVRKFLANRNVRRVIADFHVKYYGHKRVDAMRGLLEWTEVPEPARTAAHEFVNGQPAETVH